ncbi:metalloproteinase inhibitor 4 [Pyxicephalus adspersus]|uniref:metalloproteinase inhibitor 4 n=1 Tax=Pyxicephalus adspersus TaxID=30357 RepID=UPI003B5C19FA
MKLFSHTLLFGTVFLLTLKELTQACSCFPTHPQQHFCNADVVLRGKVVSIDFVNANNDYRQVRYGIKVIKIFKGKIKHIDSVYTSAESSLCGIQLDVDNKMEYLLTGFLMDNKVTISLCGLSIPWNYVSEFQKKSLSFTYQMGCMCKITYCFVESCDNNAPNECLWKDWVNEHTLGGQEAQNYACIQRRDGTCIWYPRLPVKQPSYESHP